MNNVYENIEGYNLKKNQEILAVFDDAIVKK